MLTDAAQYTADAQACVCRQHTGRDHSLQSTCLQQAVYAGHVHVGALSLTSSAALCPSRGVCLKLRLWQRRSCAPWGPQPLHLPASPQRRPRSSKELCERCAVAGPTLCQPSTSCVGAS